MTNTTPRAINVQSIRPDLREISYSRQITQPELSGSEDTSGAKVRFSQPMDSLHAIIWACSVEPVLMRLAVAYERAPVIVSVSVSRKPGTVDE